jgi:5-(carboxyamino)imidazole ribonucleotide synthase
MKRASKKPLLRALEPKPIGILGGGQLARMLALKAHELGLKISILSENADDPAAQVAPLWQRGSLSSKQDLGNFLKTCRLATFESEFLDAGLLAALELETKTPILPRPADIGLIQDRLTQKQLLEKHGLPTAKFHKVESADEAWWARMVLGGETSPSRSAKNRSAREPAPVVFKKRRFGYDGYGTFVIRTQKDMEAFVAAELTKKSAHGFIAEEFVPFKREVAVMLARSSNGQTRLLPFVESFQQDSRCLWVKGPLKTNARFTALAAKLGKFINTVGYTGVMGVELFETERGLLVNELAPRVHNSGHYSLDALSEDQFTLHLKCILGQELGEPKLNAKGFAMMNLLGSSTVAPTWRLPTDARLHWYGKNENRPGRKMGHINALGATPEGALAVVQRERRKFEV